MHTTKIEVRFSDCDSFRHVNNAVYLTYAEQARISFFDDILGNSIDWKTKGLILAKAEANYLKPIVLKDNIEVETSCTKIGNKSLTIRYTIVKIEDNKRTEMCNGETVLVGFDYVNNKSIEIPNEWREKLQNHA